MQKARTRVCIPICENSWSALEASCKAAEQWCDIIELRLDYLDDSELADAGPKLDTLSKKFSQPIILTFRPAEQGGNKNWSLSERIKFWQQDFPAYILRDLEMDLVDAYAKRGDVDWSRVIISHHDFSGVPADLDQLYEKMRRSPARILKLAVSASDATDCLPIFELLKRGSEDRREVIAIAMRGPGVCSRILGPSRGAFLTYASLGDSWATAPGQVTAHDLRDIYRINMIDEATQIYGLVGEAITHSLSPHMHNAAFASNGINAVYLPFEVHDLRSFIERMVDPRSRELEWTLRGLSITAPHKTEIIQHLDEIDPISREIGAVNTVLIEGDRLRGYNTDAAGMVEPLKRDLGSLKGSKVALIGAGGAARAAVWALLQEGAAITLFVRSSEKADELSKHFNVAARPLVDASFADYQLVINATPLGSGIMRDQSPVTAKQLAGEGWAYDLIYNPLETIFMKEARMAGREVLGGLPMLVEQARLQFKLWTGIDPTFQIMNDAAMNALSQKTTTK